MEETNGNWIWDFVEGQSICPEAYHAKRESESSSSLCGKCQFAVGLSPFHKGEQESISTPEKENNGDTGTEAYCLLEEAEFGGRDGCIRYMRRIAPEE